jgi:hypothetical protein
VFTTSLGASWKTNDGDNFLSQASGATVGGVYPPLAPGLTDSSVGVAETDALDGIIVSAYPNPFLDKFTVQFNAFESAKVVFSLTDLAGRVILEKELGQLPVGLHYLEVETPEVKSGAYVFSLTIDEQRMVRNMVKY